MSLTYPRDMFFPLFWVMLHPIDDRAEHLFFAVHVKKSAGYQFVHLKIKKNDDIDGKMSKNDVTL